MDIFLHIYNKSMYYINSPEFVNLFINNRFYLILMVVILVRLKNTTYSSLWLSSLVNIPGTILHELMHLLVGAVMNAHPCNFTVFPRKDEDGDYVMGSVGFRNITYYNAIPAALAPLLLLPIGFYFNRYWLPTMSPTTLNYSLYVLLQTIIIENAIPSDTDFRVAFSYFGGVLMYGTFFLLLLFFI